MNVNLYAKPRSLGDVFRVRILSWRDGLGFSPQALHANTRVCKRETRGDFMQIKKVMWRWSRKVFEDSGLEEWGGMTTNQGVPTVTYSWVRQRTNIPPWASRRNKAWWHLILDFWLPELGGNKYLLCWATRFVVNCCSSHKELMHLDNGTLGLWNGIWNICLHD